MRRAGVLGAAVLISLAMTPSTGAQAPGPLTVYSSLPLSGADTAQAQAIVQAARLAVEESGTQIRYVSLNDATARAGAWTPQRTAKNAARAARDGSTIA